MAAVKVQCMFGDNETYALPGLPEGWHSLSLNMDHQRWNITTLYACPKHFTRAGKPIKNTNGVFAKMLRTLAIDIEKSKL